jgi:UDP:flavonoid glycosyltransferase YjiC (YdhE family)
VRVLLSTYDSRGGIEPLAALGVRLQALGAEVLVCAPPDCAERLAEVSVPLVPAGEPVRAPVHRATPPRAPRPRLGRPGPVDDRDDCFAVGEVNQQALFGRVAAVVHHGGAGTTTTSTRAGAPQVVVPQWADQPYWASRVADLGLGAAHGVHAPPPSRCQPRWQRP